MLNAGTGFFFGSPHTVLTAAHVATGCRSLTIGSETVPLTAASLQRVDRRSDLAVLRVPGAAPPAILRESDIVDPETPLTAFGYPAAGPLLTATETRPQLLNMRARPGSPVDLRRLLWLRDERIEHGWSGGPVLDTAGGVVGVIYAIVADPHEAALVFGQPERGVAEATGVAAIRDVVGRTGMTSVARGEPRQAVVRVFCWR